MDGPEERDESRWYPEFPRVGVGVVVIRDGCILMVKRAREPDKGKWSIPGGALEVGETLAEGARREILEECSVEVDIEGVMDATDKIVKDGDGRTRYHFVLVDMAGRYAGGEARARSDATVCRWVDIGEVAGLDLTDNLRDLLKRKGII